MQAQDPAHQERRARTAAEDRPSRRRPRRVQSLMLNTLGLRGFYAIDILLKLYSNTNQNSSFMFSCFIFNTVHKF
jgi:hypothetical protein